VPKFKPGQSGNPAGRPRASSSHQKIRQAILQSAPEIIDAMIEQAKSGDTAAAKLLLDRIIAPMKAGDSHVDITLSGEMLSDARTVLTAIGSSQITPSQGQVLLGSIASLARIEEIAEIDQGMTKLETGENECHPLSNVLKNLKAPVQSQG
jgi:hypothetical protein